MTGSDYSGSGATFYGTVRANQFYNPSYNSSDPTTSAIYVAGTQKAVVSYSGTGPVQSPFVIGHCAGNITVGAVTAPLSVTGDLDSGVKFRMKSLGVSGTPQPLTVGGDLEGLVQIDDAAYGALTIGGTIGGQMLINASAGSNSWGTTFGSLSVDGSSISDIPYYSSTALGSGAVGLVPFRMYGTACFPPNGSTVPPPSTAVPVGYRFYGPVKKYAATSDPYIKIERAVVGTSTWTDITSSFSISIHGRSVDIEFNGTLWFADGYKYRVSPSNSDNHLICDLPDLGSPPAVSSTNAVFEFTIDDAEGGLGRP